MLRGRGTGANRRGLITAVPGQGRTTKAAGASPATKSEIGKPEVIAQEIADDLEAALEQFITIAEEPKQDRWD